jgi:multidrug efflux pump subunit AcrA (membrane-fusion protein)
MLPIAAVNQDKGKSSVTVLEKNGQTKQVPVTTGHTTLQDVEIQSGLKVGQTVVYDD